MTPLAFEELEREMHQRIYRFVMQLRFVVAPLPLLVGGFVVVTDPTLWRRLALGTLVTVAFALGILHDYRVRAQNPPKLHTVIFVVGAGLHPVILVATGGVLSPVLLAMLLVTFAASTMFPRRASGQLVSLQIAIVALTALLEYTAAIGSLIPLPFKTTATAGPSGAFLLIYASIAGLFFLVTREVGCRIQQAFAAMLERTIAARDQSLEMHRNQLADLTLLSSEIAHELKNPLASVKGLAALLARRSHGEEPEPLVILRREVDRMQGILEEFLNLSRPLLPLNLTTVDLTTLASDVAGLHEGLTELRRVNVEIDAPIPVEVACDARKVRQILVNLLQNSLDACDDGGHIVFRVNSSADAAEVVLEDDGRGIDPAVMGRLFDAGVTSKTEGFGIGLNVARGLARQHGGDLTLTARSPRGCRATLRLPRRPSLDLARSFTTGPRSQKQDVRSPS